MKILTRYIFKEMLGPTLLGFGFYTFIILMKNLFDFAGMIIKRSLPLATTGRLLYLSLPHIIVLTVPMSLLFGILIAVGRLSSDSEIIAMRALGISTRTIYRPVFLFSFLVFLLNLYLMNFVLPHGNAELSTLRTDIFTSQIEKELKPRVFYDEYENLMIYVNDVDPRTAQWKGVLVADSRSAEETRSGTNSPALTVAQQIQAARHDATQPPPVLPQRASNKIVIAETGNLSVLKPGKQVWLNLQGARTHLWDPKKPERYDINSNAVQRMRLPDKYSDNAAGYQRSLREMTFRELMEQARWSRYSRDPDARETYWAAKVEMNKMFAIPFACIVFGVLGLPLGITNRRGGKSSGFSLSIAIILIYYVLINNGEHLATSGKIGAGVAMWAPNLVLLAVGIYLLIRANRDAGAQRSETGLLKRLGDLFRNRRTEAAAAGDEEEEPVALSRFDITFPNTLDRYILREFLKVLALVLISTAALFVIVDYTDLSGDIRANHIPFHSVFAYYRFLVFQILNYTVPISVLVSTLVTFGMFSKNNEVTAFKSGGMSLYRAALPVVTIAAAISVLAYLQLDYVLPYSNQRVEELRSKIKAKRGPAAIVATQHQQRLWFLGKGRYIINFLNYDREAKELSQVQVLELHPTEFRLTRRVYAERARWDGVGWEFSNGWMRSFADNGSSTYAPIQRPLRLYYSERPEDFATESRAPDQMTFAQLHSYIETIRKSGYAAEELSVKLYTKTSWPFISLVMALIALPFAFRIGKRGALYGVGIALILGIVYWMVYAVFTKFGEVGNLPAVLSAWSANILFAIAALYMFLNVET